jgi:hypothetical protein
VTDDARTLARARLLVARPGARIDAGPGGYALRPNADRRARPLLRFGEKTFVELAREPGLRCDGVGWTARPRPAPAAPAAPPPGRPGLIAGERSVTEPDGAVRRRAANLGESPIAWLARRKDADGRPFLSAAEAAAGERLRDDFQRAGTIGRLTMNWGASPRDRHAGGERVDPLERGRLARARLRAALGCVDPNARDMLIRVCLTGSALEAAERALGLKRREGKRVLKAALARLAEHYRIGT